MKKKEKILRDGAAAELELSCIAYRVTFLF